MLCHLLSLSPLQALCSHPLTTHGQSINLSFANHQDLLPKVIKAKYFPYMLRMNNNLSTKTSMLFHFCQVLTELN